MELCAEGKILLSDLDGDKYIKNINKKIPNCKMEAANSVHFSNNIVLVLTDFNLYN
jgi:hypothetical protein